MRAVGYAALALLAVCALLVDQRSAWIAIITLAGLHIARGLQARRD